MDFNNKRSAVVAVALWCVGCTQASLPLVSVPRAAVVSGQDAGVLFDLHTALVTSGVLDAEPRVAGWDALLRGKPFVLSLVPGVAGAEPSIVVALRVPRAAAFLAGGDVVVGDVRRVQREGESFVVLVRGDRALIAHAGFGTTQLALAGLLQALSTTSNATVLPTDPTHVHVDGTLDALFSTTDGDDVDEGAVPPALNADVWRDGGSWVLSGAMRVDDDVRAAWAETPPTWACTLQQGAALIVSIPRFDIANDAPVAASIPDDTGEGSPANAVAPGERNNAPDVATQHTLPADKFAGLMVAAAYPLADGDTASADDPLSLASIVVAGVPRDAAAGEALWASARDAAGAQAAVAQDQGRRALVAEGKRRVRIIKDEGVFAFGMGRSAPVDRVRPGATCASPLPTLWASGPKLAQILMPALVNPTSVVRALVGGLVQDAMPLSRLAHVDTVQVDIHAGAPGELALRATVALLPIASP